MKRLTLLVLIVLALGSTVAASERVRLVHSAPLMASSGAQSTPTATMPTPNAVPCDGTVWTLDPGLGAVQAVPLSRTVTTKSSVVEGCVFVHTEHGWTGLWFVDEEPSSVLLAAPLESELVLARAEE